MRLKFPAVLYIYIWAVGLGVREQRVSKVCPVLEAEINTKQLLYLNRYIYKQQKDAFAQQACVCVCV